MIIRSYESGKSIYFKKGESVMDYWKDLFQEHILARREMYYSDGAVQDLEKTEYGYHVVVEGTEDYEVDIEMKTGRSVKCTAPVPMRTTGTTANIWWLCSMRSRNRKAQIA